MEKFEIRVLLRHYLKQGFNATEAAKKYAKWKVKEWPSTILRNIGIDILSTTNLVSKISHVWFGQLLWILKLYATLLKSIHQPALAGSPLNWIFLKHQLSGTFTPLGRSTKAAEKYYMI